MKDEQTKRDWKQAADWNRESLERMKKRYPGKKCLVKRKLNGTVEIWFGGEHKVSYMCLAKKQEGKKKMKKLILAAVLLLLVSIPKAEAYETSYFHRFRGKEIRVTVQLTEQRKKSYWVVVKRIDSRNGILEGKSNSGREYIQISKIVEVRVDDETVHHVLNPHREF